MTKLPERGHAARHLPNTLKRTVQQRLISPDLAANLVEIGLMFRLDRVERIDQDGLAVKQHRHLVEVARQQGAALLFEQVIERLKYLFCLF